MTDTAVTDIDVADTEAAQPSGPFANAEGRAFLRQRKAANAGELAYLEYLTALENLTISVPLRGERSVLDLTTSSGASRAARRGGDSSPPRLRGHALAEKLIGARAEAAELDRLIAEAGDEQAEAQSQRPDVAGLQMALAAQEITIQTLESDVSSLIARIDALEPEAAKEEA